MVIMVERDIDCNVKYAESMSVLAGLLSRSLLRPTLDLAGALIDGSYLAAFESVVDAESDPLLIAAMGVLRGYCNDCAAKSSEEVRLGLEVEYNRLFVGPGKLIAPPYESYYASMGPDGKGGRLRTSDERSVVRAYRAGGYSMPDAFIDLPDHIAIELDFLALLARDEANAWSAGLENRALEVREAFERFIEEHLSRWVGACAERVDEGAHLGFYPAIMRIATVVME